MFDILEEIALEQAKNQYQKKTKKKKKVKKNALVSASFIDKKQNKLGSRVNKEATSSMNVFSGRSKSISMSGERGTEFDDLAAIGRV